MLRELPWPKMDDLGEIILGLERISHFLKYLDNPHHHFPRVIHIAGTNGKGSTAAFIRSLLTAAGERCHTYLSPHLLGWNERILLYNKVITDEELLECSLYCGEIARQNSLMPSHFEALTAIAFHAFAKNPADFIILEVGLGGRLDATNIISDPTCSVITPIGLDHTEFLGSTIDKIAREKAAIMRRHSPCIVGRQIPEALAEINKEGETKNTPLFRFNHEWVIEDNIFSSTRYSPREFQIKLPALPLVGTHQYDNLGTALAALTFGCGISINSSILHKALDSTIWPGRLECLTLGILSSLLPNFRKIWLDVAHNAAAAEVVAKWINESTTYITVVVQLTRNRNYREFLAPLVATGQISRIIALDKGGQQVSRTKNDNEIEYFSVENFESALDLLRTFPRHSVAHDLLFCGSHALVASCKLFGAGENKF